LLGVQLLDGVGAGIYEALTPLLIADVMRGTGRYNLAQGAVATTQGVGRSAQRAGADCRGGSAWILRPPSCFSAPPPPSRGLSFSWAMPETNSDENAATSPAAAAAGASGE